MVKGEISLYTEYYEPLFLSAGDTAYIDSKMRHAFLNRTRSSSQILSVCLGSGLDFPALEVKERHSIKITKTSHRLRPGYRSCR